MSRFSSLQLSWSIANFSAEKTTISPFLLSKNVSRYFVPQGPALTTDAVQDISRILKRERPSEDDIFEGCKTVESRDDDLWPVNGEQDPEVVESRWNEGNQDALPSYKRRRIDNSAMSDKLVDIRGGKYLANSSAESLIRTTTMQNRSTFSYPCSNGFVSAAAQLHHFKEETQKRNMLTERKNAALRSVDGSQYGKVHAGIPKTIKKCVSQGSLLSFWSAQTEINPLHGRTTTSPQDLALFEDEESKKNGEQESEESDARMSSMATLGAAFRNSHKSKPPVSNIPQELADHKLRSIAESSRPYLRVTECEENTKQYVFLSSSPSPCENSQKENMDTRKDISPLDDESTLKSTSSDIRSTSSDIRSTTDFRPATTFHSTSLAQVRATSNLPKKTLGVRRSMAGWSSGGSQGFSVPRRATKMPCNPLTCHSHDTG